MFTKTKKNEEENNDLETNHYFSIPKEIKSEIDKKWFYLYEWIGSKDIKNSLERDFLKFLRFLWIPIAVILIIPTLVMYFFVSYNIYLYFFWVIILVNIIFFIFLSILSIKRSKNLKDNAYVLLTDTHISVNWKIQKNWEISKETITEINKISKLFEEKIFEKSNIENSKNNLMKHTKDKLLGWYSYIWRIASRKSGRNTMQFVLLLMILYTMYLVSMAWIYIIWIFFVSIFWVITSFVNKKILLISGHKVTKINDDFDYIDEYSKLLNTEKDSVLKLINQAIDNDWKDSLLTKISKKLEWVNKFANLSINKNIELKKNIQNSKYNEMFNFNKYNIWIKNQILIPLEDIKKLLDINLEKLIKQYEEVKIQISESQDSSKKGALEVSEKRLEMRISEMKKHIEKMNLYINKLK